MNKSNKNKVNFSDLKKMFKSKYKNNNLSSDEALEAVFNLCADLLSSGLSVSIGKVGIIKVVKKDKREFMNPKTKKIQTTSRSKTLRLDESASMKKILK